MTNERKSNLRFIDMVGILGGLYVVLDLLFHLIAPRFSHSFFFSDVANRLFITRKKSCDNPIGSTINGQFKEVDICWYHTLLAPFTCCCKMCRSAGTDFCRLVKTHRSGKHKIQEQLEVGNLLRRIARSHAVYKNFMNMKQQELVNYQRDFVLEDSEDSDCYMSDGCDKCDGANPYEDLTKRLTDHVCLPKSGNKGVTLFDVQMLETHHSQGGSLGGTGPINLRNNGATDKTFVSIHQEMEESKGIGFAQQLPGPATVYGDDPKMTGKSSAKKEGGEETIYNDSVYSQPPLNQRPSTLKKTKEETSRPANFYNDVQSKMSNKLK